MSIDILLLVHQMDITQQEVTKPAPKVHWLDHPTASPRLLNEPEFSYGWACADCTKVQWKEMMQSFILYLNISYILHPICMPAYPMIPSGTPQGPRSEEWRLLWPLDISQWCTSPISRLHKIQGPDGCHSYDRCKIVALKQFQSSSSACCTVTSHGGFVVSLN